MYTSLKLYMAHENTIHENNSEPIKLDLQIPLECPYCGTKDERVGTWGNYPTSKGEVRRYKCKTCDKTFNPSKIPFLNKHLSELIYRLAQLTIEDQIAVNSFARKYSIPESSLRRPITEIKTFLSDSFEKIKQLHEKKMLKQGKKMGDLRIIFYDEGFLKILGKTGFLMFTLDGEGKPITLTVEPNRDSETIYNHFLQAITQLGGIDVIIGDGARAITAAVKALKLDVILVQQIHSGKAKRARIYKFQIIQNRKAIIETTIEVHTGSLLSNTESKITVRKKIVYPPTYSPHKKKKKSNNKKNNNKKCSVKRVGTLTPVEGANKGNTGKSTKAQLLKGHQVFLRTGENIFENELNYIPLESDYTASDCPSLIELQAMISLTQAALPDQFITSNRAEVFNALYDRYNKSWGVTTIKHANDHARAWAVMKFYPDEAKQFINQHQWYLPYSLIRQLGFLLFSKMEVC